MATKRSIGLVAEAGSGGLAGGRQLGILSGEAAEG